MEPKAIDHSLITSDQSSDSEGDAVVPRPPGDYILLTLIHSAIEYVVISQIHHRMANCHDPTTATAAAWKCLHWQYVPSVNYDYAIIILVWASCSRYMCHWKCFGHWISCSWVVRTETQCSCYYEVCRYHIIIEFHNLQIYWGHLIAVQVRALHLSSDWATSMLQGVVK